MAWSEECGGGAVRGAALAVSMTTELKKNFLWHTNCLWKLSTLSPWKRLQPPVHCQTIYGESGNGQPGQRLEQSCSSFSIGLKMVIPLTCKSDTWCCSYICKTLCVSSQLWTPPPAWPQKISTHFYVGTWVCELHPLSTPVYPVKR